MHCQCSTCAMSAPLDELAASDVIIAPTPDRGRCFKTPLEKRCNLPDSEVLSRLYCAHALRGAARRWALVSGGMGLSVRLAARLFPCFEHPVHPSKPESKPGGYGVSTREP